MRNLKKKAHKTSRVPRARNAHGRQRQRLIEACISALHIYGPSRTTVEKVVAIAKMSPGIVRFYFSSKAAMLVASLKFLAAEFEEQLLEPVARLKSRPVTALELMVDLYLDPDIASPRKVSVWYAFWGEASSRQEYYDICGQKDESFASLVRELIEALILDTSQPHLDPDGIALGLIGVLEMLWQDFAFRSEAEIDRAAAKHRAMAYLTSIFPGQFSAYRDTVIAPVGDLPLAAWVYADARIFAAEREHVFSGSWQLVAHQAQLPGPGDFVAVDLGVERVLVVRGAAAEVCAFRNSCTETPHILTAASSGRLSHIRCAVHDLEFGLDGRRHGPRGAADLKPLELRFLEGLIFVRTEGRRQPRADDADPWVEFALPPGARPLAPPADAAIAADWKLVIEQWLESDTETRNRLSGQAQSRDWSARWYERLLSSASDFRWPRRFFPPNHLVEMRPDGLTILQVLPRATGRSLLRRYDLTRCEDDRLARVAAYVAARLHPCTRPTAVAVAESTQQGIVNYGHQAAGGVHIAPATAAFRRRLVALIPMMALPRPPNSV